MMKVRAAEFCSRTMFKFSVGFFLLMLIALPGYGQTSLKAVAKHDQELRKSLKEADKSDARYKDTHLNTGTYKFKKGKAGRRRLRDKKDEREKYRFNVRGDAATGWGLFKRKPKEARTKLFN